MAQPGRETERETYGGERRWQEGAGESWTSREATGPQGESGRHRDPETARWYGSRLREDGAERGVLRELTDELGITRPGPKDYQRSDVRIREDVCERLWHEPHVDVGDVSVEVTDGVVKLDGSVPHRQMKHTIEDIAASCRGVRDVENRVRVAGGPDGTSGAGIV